MRRAIDSQRLQTPISKIRLSMWKMACLQRQLLPGVEIRSAAEPTQTLLASQTECHVDVARCASARLWTKRGISNIQMEKRRTNKQAATTEAFRELSASWQCSCRVVAPILCPLPLDPAYLRTHKHSLLSQRTIVRLTKFDLERLHFEARTDFRQFDLLVPCLLVCVMPGSAQ